MTTKEFFEKCAANAEIAGKLAAAKTPEECFEIAKANGVTDSIDVFTACAKEINDAAAEMDPSEVDAIVGGGDTVTTATTTTAAPFAASAALT